MPINFKTLVTSEKNLRKMFCEFYEHVIKTQKTLLSYLEKDKPFTEEQFKNISQLEKQSNSYEAQVLDETSWIISKDMPRAAHLRYLIAIIRSIKDLERMSDFAFNIANHFYLSKKAPEKKVNDIIVSIIKESLVVVEAVYNNIAEGTKQDQDFYVNKATKLINEFSRKYRAHFKQLGQLTFKTKKNLNDKMGIFTVIKNIERNADHAYNIIENFLYIGDPDFYFYRISRKNKIK